MLDTNSSSLGSFVQPPRYQFFTGTRTCATPFELHTMPITSSSCEGIVGTSIMAARGHWHGCAMPPTNSSLLSLNSAPLMATMRGHRTRLMGISNRRDSTLSSSSPLPRPCWPLCATMHRSLVQQRQGRLSLGAVATRDHLLFWAVAAVTSKEDEKYVVWFFLAFWGGLRRPSIVRLFLFLHMLFSPSRLYLAGPL